MPLALDDRLLRVVSFAVIAEAGPKILADDDEMVCHLDDVLAAHRSDGSKRYRVFEIDIDNRAPAFRHLFRHVEDGLDIPFPGFQREHRGLFRKPGPVRVHDIVEQPDVSVLRLFHFISEVGPHVLREGHAVADDLSCKRRRESMGSRKSLDLRDWLVAENALDRLLAIDAFEPEPEVWAKALGHRNRRGKFLVGKNQTGIRRDDLAVPAILRCGIECQFECASSLPEMAQEHRQSQAIMGVSDKLRFVERQDVILRISGLVRPLKRAL